MMSYGFNIDSKGDLELLETKLKAVCRPGKGTLANDSDK